MSILPLAGKLSDAGSGIPGARAPCVMCHVQGAWLCVMQVTDLPPGRLAAQGPCVLVGCVVNL
jgi:hypothetical protein